MERELGAEAMRLGRRRRRCPRCSEAGLRHWVAVTLLPGLRSARPPRHSVNGSGRSEGPGSRECISWASPPSVPLTLKPHVRALLPSCSPGPGVRDREALVDDIRGDRVGEGHRRSGRPCEDVEVRSSREYSGTLKYACVFREQGT